VGTTNKSFQRPESLTETSYNVAIFRCVDVLYLDIALTLLTAPLDVVDACTGSDEECCCMNFWYLNQHCFDQTTWEQVKVLLNNFSA